MGNLRLYEGPENPWVPLDLGLIPIETNTQSPKFQKNLDFCFAEFYLFTWVHLSCTEVVEVGFRG